MPNTTIKTPAKSRKKSPAGGAAPGHFLLSEAEPDVLTWQEAALDFVRQMHGGSEKKTQQFYQSQLSIFGRWMTAQGTAVCAFRVRHLREYIAFRAESGISECTRRHDVIAIRMFCRFAAGEGYMPSNPLVDYAVPHAEKGYRKSPTQAEVRALLAAIPARWSVAVNPKVAHVPPKTRTFLSRRNYAIIAGVVDTACRIGEILALGLSDYDAAQGVIHIRKSKGNRPRTLPVSPQWQKAVDAWLRVRPKCDSPALFITRYGEQISPSNFGDQFHDNRIWARQTYEAECAAAGTVPDDAFLSSFTLHGLRHYAATLLSEAGWEVARKMLGHSSISTTERYVHSDQAFLKDGHASASPLGRLLVNKRSEAQKKRRLV
ncbi:MAG: tyrosine-type recombinase/integrase [Janthinobacterium lividum]